MGEDPPTRANRPPTPDISPKWVSRLFFVILWPVETVKNQFYISQNEPKLTSSNAEFQKFSRGDIPDPSFKGRERGPRERGIRREGRERKKGNERMGKGTEGKENEDHPLTIFGLKVALAACVCAVVL